MFDFSVADSAEEVVEELAALLEDVEGVTVVAGGDGLTDAIISVGSKHYRVVIEELTE